MTPGPESLSPRTMADRLPRSGRVKDRANQHNLLSSGVVAVAVMLSALHILNFLNYTVLATYVDPQVTRSVLLVSCGLGLIVRNAANLEYHFRRSWDMYAICLLALLSAVYSIDPVRTLKYGAWLVLSVYLGTELSARIRGPNDMVAALSIVLLPASFFVAAVNVTIGPVVEGTGRQFGALGSHHIDTAYAMDFICLFLAIRALPVELNLLPKWIRWGMWVVLGWAAHQAIFGLTRSVWLGVALSLGLYYFRHVLTLKSLLAMLFAAILIVAAIDYLGIDRILPDAVKGRLDVTERRIESGDIDPRIQGIRYAYQTVLEKPLGTGYAVDSSHNSYMNILLNLGWIGFGLALVAIARSFIFVFRVGFGWVLFFAIGAVPLMLQAFFEVQTWPGQGNFIPLLLWYALSRSRFAERGSRPSRPIYTFVDG